MTWMKDFFGTEKPVIGLLHLMAMPTDPGYDRAGGMQQVLARARREIRALQNGGIDAILFCNEFSIPYIRHVEPVTIAAMAWVIGALSSELCVPFGVHAAHDPASTLDLAGAVGAGFVRGYFSGINGGDYGMMNFEPGELMRRRMGYGSIAEMEGRTRSSGSRFCADRSEAKTLNPHVGYPACLLSRQIPSPV